MLLSSTIESAFMMAAGQDGNIPFAFGTSSNSESSASLTADTNVGRPVNKGLGMLQMSAAKWSAQVGSPRLWSGLRRCCKTLSQRFRFKRSFRPHALRRCRPDEVLPHQNPADDETDDHEHDRKLDQCETIASVVCTVRSHAAERGRNPLTIR